MKKKTLLCFFFTVTCFCMISIYFLYANTSLKKEVRSMKDAKNAIENSSLNLEEMTLNVIKYGNANFLHNPFIKDEKGKLIKLSDLLKDKEQQLFIRISKRNCMSCILSFVSIIQSSSINKNKVVYLTDYEKEKERSYYKNMLGIDTEVYVISDLGLPIEQEDFPYAFIIDKDLSLHNLFIPLYDNENLSKRYIEMIEELLRA